MSYTIPLDFVVLLALLVLSAMGEGFGAFKGGLFVVFWSFRRWWEKTTWTTKGPPRTSAKPWPRSKGPKDQKDHGC
jgi:hypothetical protein